MFLKAAPKADYIYKKEKETYFTIVSGKAFSPGRPGSVLTSSAPDPLRREVTRLEPIENRKKINNNWNS